MNLPRQYLRALVVCGLACFLAGCASVLKVLQSETDNWNLPQATLEIESPTEVGAAILRIELAESDPDRDISVGWLKLSDGKTTRFLRGGLLKHRESGNLELGIGWREGLLFTNLVPGIYDLAAVWMDRMDPRTGEDEIGAKFAHPWGEHHSSRYCILLVDLEGSHKGDMGDFHFVVEAGSVHHLGKLSLLIENDESRYDDEPFPVNGGAMPERRAHISTGSLVDAEFEGTLKDTGSDFETFKKKITGPHAEEWRAIADQR